MNEQQLAAVKKAVESMTDADRLLEDEGYGRAYQQEAITALQSIISQEALDKKAENARELGLSYDDAVKGGVGIMLGGKRIDPSSIYAEPKIGCVNHDCDKCKAVQEPVALESGKRLIIVDQSFDDLMYWLDRCEDKGHLENCPDLVEPWSAFQYENYTTQPAAQKPWVGLTADEMLEALTSVDPETKRLPVGFSRFARAIEAKLKEKNT